MRLWSFVSSHDVEAVAVVQVVQVGCRDGVHSVPELRCRSAAGRRRRAVRPRRAGAPAAPQRLDVRDQLQQLLFGDQALERRHDRLEAGHDLRLRVQDRLADVRLVGDRPSAPPCELRPAGRRRPSAPGRGPAPSSRWQVMQARSWNSFAPASASVSAGVAAARATPGSRPAPSPSPSRSCPSASCRSTRAQKRW